MSWWRIPTAPDWPISLPAPRPANCQPGGHAVVPLDQVANAHQALTKGGLRGRYVLKP